eukprot:11390936-Karenia_brevis.AAC.1
MGKGLSADGPGLMALTPAECQKFTVDNNLDTKAHEALLYAPGQVQDKVWQKGVGDHVRNPSAY